MPRQADDSCAQETSVALGEWRGRNVLVTDAASQPILWLDGGGVIRDGAGTYCDPVVDFGSGFDSVEELALVVAEWICCAGLEREGIQLYDVHPELHESIVWLVPKLGAIGH